MAPLKPVRIPSKIVQVPQWANWVAQDSCGTWYVFEAQPTAFGCCFLPPKDVMRIKKIGKEDPNPRNWRDTLRRV